MSTSQQTTYITGLKSEILNESPAPAGRLALATDTNSLYVSTGSEWIKSDISSTSGLSYNLGTNVLPETPIIHVDASDSGTLLTRNLTTPSDGDGVEYWLNKTDDLAMRGNDSPTYRVVNGNPQLDLFDGKMYLGSSDPELSDERAANKVPERWGSFTVVQVMTPHRGRENWPNLFEKHRSWYQQGLVDGYTTGDYTTPSTYYVNPKRDGSMEEGTEAINGGRYNYSQYENLVYNIHEYPAFSSHTGGDLNYQAVSNVTYPDWRVWVDNRTDQTAHWVTATGGGMAQTLELQTVDGRYRTGAGTEENPYKSNYYAFDDSSLRDTIDVFNDRWLGQPQIITYRVIAGFEGRYSARSIFGLHTWHYRYYNTARGSQTIRSVNYTGEWRLKAFNLGGYSTGFYNGGATQYKTPWGVNEVMVFNSALSDGELDTIGQHLKNKWGARYFTQVY